MKDKFDEEIKQPEIFLESKKKKMSKSAVKPTKQKKLKKSDDEEPDSEKELTNKARQKPDKASKPKKSDFDLKTLWQTVQQLPSGVREKILYPIPLESLALLCRVSRAPFGWQLSFWKEKLKYDGYFLDTNYPLWLKSQSLSYHSAPHFYQNFARGRVLMKEDYLKQKKSVESFLISIYETKSGLLKRLPPGFNKESWREIVYDLEKKAKESWLSWAKLSNVFLDLFFQQKIAEIRQNKQFLVITAPTVYGTKLPANFETVLVRIRKTIDDDGEFRSPLEDQLLLSPLNIKGQDCDDWQSLEVVFNRLLRLNDLLQTGDLIYDTFSDYSFVLREGNQLKLFEFICEGDQSFFPPEALPFILQNELFYSANPGPYYSSVRKKNLMPSKIDGYTVVNRKGTLDLCHFADKNDQHSKTLASGETIIYSSFTRSNIRPSEKECSKKTLKDWQQVLPELDEGKWLQLAEKEELNESEEEEEDSSTDE